MAQVTTVELIDDLDGSAAEETVKFALDGKPYVIDLSGHNAGVLRDILGDYVGVARLDPEALLAAGRSRVTRKPGSGAPAANREQTAAVREWARRNGHQVSDRGRISATVQAAFDDAHRSPLAVAG
jgi:hypothetical protein